MKNRSLTCLVLVLMQETFGTLPQKLSPMIGHMREAMELWNKEHKNGGKMMDYDAMMLSLVCLCAVYGKFEIKKLFRTYRFLLTSNIHYYCKKHRSIKPYLTQARYM